ncbi:helicase-related protein [Novosphingobium panipatense]|uniref:Transcription-repair-coupling factor n=2 Tax=Novosphingobium panipatense TaxID=428991 RepID=A0ABY1QH38_9SPHN|nr:helicase-related protein [Novosphingobium panipatense]SMP71418.1 transcription-repair coupling factor (superfamily II helicase) [Novosphingobium panipatense]
MGSNINPRSSAIAPDHRSPENTAELVAVLLSELATGDIIVVAKNDHRAREIANALQAGAGSSLVLFCPGSDALPGDNAPASAANAGQRTSALRRLRLAQAEPNRAALALVTTGEGCARLYPPPHCLDVAPPVFSCGDVVDLQSLAETLEGVGYIADERVDEPGEYAVHGQIVDVYPADAENPCRMEIADGRIASLRTFDPVSQLTVAECDRIEVGRASEPVSEDGVPLFDHVPGARIVIEAGADKRRRVLLELAAEMASTSPGRATRSMCEEQRYQRSLEQHAVLEASGPLGSPPTKFTEKAHPVRAFVQEAKAALDEGNLLLLGTQRDIRFLLPRVGKALKCEIVEVQSWAEALEPGGGKAMALAMPVVRGFRFGTLLAVSATDLLGSRAHRKEAGSQRSEINPFLSGELARGDVVVHADHGICVVEGLEPSPEGGDALLLRFAAGGRRLVPVLQADRIWRYGGEESAVTLDRLDGSSWQERREEVETAVAQTARDLSRLAAERATRTAAVMRPDMTRYERFADRFPFAETADQLRAIMAVQGDLQSGHPMDRLIVGDVGYGKTEVALRAAAMAVFSGKQVALAAPTTVLVRQHLETFRRRFKGLGVNVAGLSRLSTTAERTAVKAGLADGSIDIVIGTSAIGGKGVAYADLGLVIIDEEQRFGVAEKKKLAALGTDHVLTLSATPIPRTLQAALVGLQQLTVIATPPDRRQPIRTTVEPFDEARVRAALLRERSRGGQSFVVVPRIEDIDPLADRLRRLVPELHTVLAHGKIPAAELDETMVRFADGEGDVLLATNIIEAGLDVPRANTMLVWRADMFGLSQLHQLRGRVGRGSRRGHILLLTDPEAQVAPRTLSRLKTLSAMDRLGAGFAISARDLDMRGAGDLLGEEQAGHAKLIGVDLYRHLLEKAIARARGEQADDWNPELNLGVEGRLPPEWVAEDDLRLTLYARLSRLPDLASLEAFERELVDRFGTMPEDAGRLLTIARLKVLARAASILRLDAGPAAIALTPRKGQAKALKRLGLEKSSERYLCKGDFADADTRLSKAEELLSDIA